MSVRTWFDDLKLRMSLAPIRRQRRAHRVRRLAAARPLRLESLEDRCLLSFTPAASFPVGTEPQAVVTADFNNDGRLDLATASSGGNTVSVLLGDGQGGFGDVNHFAAGTNPRSVVVADFNNDGNLDLATANEGSYSVMTPPYDVNRVSLMLGDGRGRFSAPVNDPSIYGIYGDPLSMAAGDFNRDGKMDLAVSTRDNDDGTGGYLNVWLGDGQGGVGDSYLYDLTTNSPVGLAVADLNGDDKPDVVIANQDRSTVSVLLGIGDGTFGPERSFATGPEPQAVAVGDFTGDGIPDLVAAGFASGWVDVLPGRGDGTFTARIQNFAYLGSSIATADFNGDGKLDVVTALWSGENLSVLLGRGDGTLTHPDEPWAGSSIMAVAVGDFNGDGRTDVAAADWGWNAVSVLLNDTNWLPSNPNPLPGDYNRNGAVDAADYLLWRKTLGTNVPNYTAADGNGNGVVDQADHNVWTTQFGQAVPSPTAPSGPTAQSVTVEQSPAATPQFASPIGDDAAPNRGTTTQPPTANERDAALAGLDPGPSVFHRQVRPSVRQIVAMRSTGSGVNPRRDELLLTRLAFANHDRYASDYGLDTHSVTSPTNEPEAVETLGAALDIAFTTLALAARL